MAGFCQFEYQNEPKSRVLIFVNIYSYKYPCDLNIKI
jgi:hypothetical protein